MKILTPVFISYGCPPEHIQNTSLLFSVRVNVPHLICHETLIDSIGITSIISNGF